MTSTGFFKLRDYLIAFKSLLLAVAVSATTGTVGKVAHSIARLA